MGTPVQWRPDKVVMDHLCLQAQELSQGYPPLLDASWQRGDLEDVSKLSSISLWICVQLGSQHRYRQARLKGRSNTRNSSLDAPQEVKWQMRQAVNSTVYWDQFSPAVPVGPVLHCVLSWMLDWKSNDILSLMVLLQRSRIDKYIDKFIFFILLCLYVVGPRLQVSRSLLVDLKIDLHLKSTPFPAVDL